MIDDVDDNDDVLAPPTVDVAVAPNEVADPQSLVRQKMPSDIFDKSMDASRRKIKLWVSAAGNARIYPACYWSGCAPGLDGSPLSSAS